MVRRHAAPVGVHARLAPRAVADRSRHRLRRRRGRRAVPLDRRRQTLAGAARPARATARARSGSRAPAACACTRSSSTRRTRSASSSPSRRPAPSAPTTAARPGGRSTAACESERIPDPNAEVGHCVHRIAMHPSRPNVLFMQKHWDVMRSDDARRRRGTRSAATCRATSASRSTCTRTSRRRSTSCRSRATPSTSRPTASCASTAAARGGNEWEALTKGLPQSDCYVNVLRDAMAVDSLDSCGVYFGTTGGQVYALGRRRRHAGRRSCATCRPVLSVEVQTLP